MTDRKPSPPARFARALRIADTLPTPRVISRRILASSTGAHNGLRAASYDGKVKGGTTSSHPERVAEERENAQSVTELDHLRRLSKASERFVVAVACLLVEVADGDPGDLDDYCWDDAIKDAHLIGELRHSDINGKPLARSEPGDVLAAALDRDGHLVTHVDRALDAVVEIRTLHQHYTPRASTPWEQYKRNGGRADEVCEIHAALNPPMFKPKHGTPQLCKTCADLTRIAGQRPPVELVALLEHGTQMAYRKERSRWLDACGVRPDAMGA